MKHSMYLVFIALSVAHSSLGAETAPTPYGDQLHAMRERADVSALDIEQSYREAMALEREVAELYREVRAAELAQIQRQSLAKSLEQTLLPISDRWVPDYAILSGDAQSGEDVTRYQAELQKVMQETDVMVANAEEMLRSLLPDVVEPPPTEMEEMPEEQMEESSEVLEQMLESLQESVASAVDEMVQAGETLTEPESENAEQVAAAKSLIDAVNDALTQTERSLAERATDAQQALVIALDATVTVDRELAEDQETIAQEHTALAVEFLERMEEELVELVAMSTPPIPDVLDSTEQIAQQQALDALSKAAAGDYLDLTRQMKGEDFSAAPVSVPVSQRPPSVRTHYKGASGRKVVAFGGDSAEWFKVNKWYVLGPYDNRGRMNVHRVYPPESIIDLDAHYRGKYGAELVWDYDSFAEEQVNPVGKFDEYTIFYGFTELYFEEATDAWIVIGSDDRSDLWINDMPVWQSSNKLKMWRIDEGYRKVHFKQGVNKVVFRLENGWHDLGFSLLIHTDVDVH